MFKKFISYYKPYKGMFVLDMLASLFISLIGMTYPILTKNMLNDFIPNKQVKFIVIFGLALFGCYLVRMLLRFFVQYYGHVIGVKMQADMRREMFDKLQRLPFSYYDEQETGKIMSRMTNDLMEVSELAHHGPENIFICGVTVILAFAYLMTINVVLTVIIFACVPVLVIISLLLRKRLNQTSLESRKSIASINASLESSITGIRVTKAFTNSLKEVEKFEVSNKEYVVARSRTYKAMGQFFSSTTFVTDLFNVIVLLVGGLFTFYEKINYAEYAAFVVSINIFISPLTTLINFVEQYQNGVTGFKRFLEIIEEPEEEENPNAVSLQLKGSIEFDHVSFNYAVEKEILSNVSFKVNKGETIALVGPSGGGKTTICHLIPNFYKITEGEIRIDGYNTKDITLDSLRKNIGIVQQDVFLFNGSLKENIIYGRLDATDDEVIEAAKRANIHEYIMSLEKGYDTQIGERGVKLSGGQKQRLSIARVFLKNPPILILDEATSALDNATEHYIQSALDDLCSGRTTIVVAHRLSTIKNADRIFVISEGHITESGTHNELLSLGGAYKKLYDASFQ